MSKELDKYRERYLYAIRKEMAELTFKDIAKDLKTTDKTLSAISSGRQYPTVQHGIDLCKKFGYSANWLFLGKGSEKMAEQATLDKILARLKHLK